MGRLRILLGLLVFAAILAGCGGSSKPQPKLSGEVRKPASQVFADAKRAAAAANSVHVTGTGAAGTSRGSLEAWIDRRGAAAGTFQFGTGSVKAIRVGKELYLKGDSGFWQSFGDVGLPLRRITDHWIRASAADPPFAGITGVLNWKGFISRLNIPGTWVKRGVRKFHGQRAIVLRSPSQNATLYVAATGEPYPLGLVGGQTGVAITFDQWNAVPSIQSPPKNAKPIFGH